MKRRAFIAHLGIAAAWPLGARAQQPGRIRRIGVLTGLAEGDPEMQARISMFRRSIAQLGWVDGANVRIDYRWSGGDPGKARQYAKELVSLSPDVLLATGGTTVGPLMEVSSVVPIVFANVPDPVGSGFVQSLARPGGNVTGFMQFEYSLSGKWLELLKQTAPRLTRVAVLWDPAIPAGIGQFAVIQSVAPSVGMEVSGVSVRDEDAIERGLADFARAGGGGLIVTASVLALKHRNLIVRLAVQHRLPGVYFAISFVASGGLISYGANQTDEYRHAAAYVDRILKGEKPANLPVQAPTKYEMAINLKTAKALGLEISQIDIARADEVIE